MPYDVEVFKFDEPKRFFLGWATVCSENGQPVVDQQGDVIDEAEMERYAHQFMREARVGKIMHSGGVEIDYVCSLPMTDEVKRAFGITLNPDRTGWIVGGYVRDLQTFMRIRSGELTGLSIGGTGTREEIGKSRFAKAMKGNTVATNDAARAEHGLIHASREREAKRRRALTRRNAPWRTAKGYGGARFADEVTMEVETMPETPEQAAALDRAARVIGVIGKSFRCNDDLLPAMRGDARARALLKVAAPAALELAEIVKDATTGTPGVRMAARERLRWDRPDLLAMLDGPKVEKAGRAVGMDEALSKMVGGRPSNGAAGMDAALARLTGAAA